MTWTRQHAPLKQDQMIFVYSDLVRHWDDIRFSAWASFVPRYHDTHVNFRVFQIMATDVTDVEEVDGSCYPRAYERIGSQGDGDLAARPEEAEVYLSGSVKWDGCSNWTFDEQNRVMLHFCDKDEAANIGTLFSRLYEWAKELGMDRL